MAGPARMDARRRTAASVILLLLVCAPACRKPRVVLPPAAAVVDPEAVAARFEQLIHQGCYLCLGDVLKEFRTLPPRVQEAPPVAAAVNRAAWLFVLRQKELGIVPDDDAEFAHQILAASIPPPGTATVLAELADAIPWNVIGVGEEFSDTHRPVRTTTNQRSAWRAALAADWPHDEVSAYGYLSLLCSFGPVSRAELTEVHQRYPDSPLVIYRWATCSTRDVNLDALRELQAVNERFHEAGYFLGLAESNANQFAQADEDLLAAWDAVPRFSAAGVLEADLATAAGEFDRALETLDAVLSIVPGHLRATLGRLVALSLAGRHEEAIAIADALIAGGRWFQGDAYYWRGWNRFRLERIEPALEDVVAAKGLERSLRVFTLAGLVQMARERWPEARDEFSAALRANQDACDVRLYLGYVQGELAVWPDAGGSFGRAADCFTQAEKNIRAQIARMPDPPPDAWAARQSEKLQRDLADAIAQGRSAVYNAAVAFTNAGQPDRAEPFAQRAAELPEYADRVRTLRGR